ncbi:MAG: hypothetical protein ABW252_08470 [Polyangiales bacterium]
MRERGWISAAWLVTSVGCATASHDDGASHRQRVGWLEEPINKGSAFPCEVDAILVEYCQICHGDPALGAPFSLMRPQDFQGESYADPDKTMAVASRERITAAQPGKRMPPPALGTLTDQDLATLTGWLDRGAPAGSGCGGGLDASTLDAGASMADDASTTDDGGRT